MRQIDLEYGLLVESILRAGVSIRGGLSLPHQSLTLDISQDFPIIGCRKVDIQKSLDEVEWFFSPQHNHLDGLKEAKNFWRKFSTDGFFESSYGEGIQKHWNLAREEVKIEGRRAVVNLWDVHSHWAFQPPCHTSLVFSRYYDQLHLAVMSRSQDVMCGLPYDLMNYAILAHKMAHETGTEPKWLSLFMADVHIYHKDIEVWSGIPKNPKYPEASFNYLTSALKWSANPPEVRFKVEVSQISH